MAADREPDTSIVTATILEGVPVPVVFLSGELDVATAEEVRRAVTELLPHVPDGGLVIDLREVTFVDSRGVTALLGVHRMLEGRPVTLRGVHRNVEATLELLAVASLFTIVPHEDAHDGREAANQLEVISVNARPEASGRGIVAGDGPFHLRRRGEGYALCGLVERPSWYPFGVGHWSDPAVIGARCPDCDRVAGITPTGS